MAGAAVPNRWQWALAAVMLVAAALILVELSGGPARLGAVGSGMWGAALAAWGAISLRIASTRGTRLLAGVMIVGGAVVFSINGLEAAGLIDD